MIGLVALTLSGAAHAAVVVTMLDDTPTAIDLASAPPAPAQLGNGFADMVAGMPQPVTPAPPPDAPAAEAADQATPSATPASAAPVTAPAAGAAPAVPATPSDTTTVTPEQATAASPNVIEAQPEVQVQTATADTSRPRGRPDTLGQEPPRRETPRQQPTRQRPAQAQAQGNADQDQRRGTETATQTQAPAANSGQGQQPDANAQANARAAANYGNRVYRAVSRTRRVRTNIRGTAVVSFRVAANGALASVAIGRSSGNAELDRIAMDHIRRAAPFPPPPPGAQTRFSVEFSGR